MKRMRWKAHFFLNPKATGASKETYGFKSTKSPPVISELKEFEDCMIHLIQNIQFENKASKFPYKLSEDLKKVKNDHRLTVKADKTTNYYKMDRDKYNDLVHDNVTKTYRKSDRNEVNSINKEAKHIADIIDLSDRTEQLAEKEVFINLKDHKPNFLNRPVCRLISPTKSELGHVSKQILNRLIENVLKATKVNLWKSTQEVLQWFRNFPQKEQGTFINFDIVEFYPSISEKLLRKAIEFARHYTAIQDYEVDIIIHTKRTVIFSKDEPWKKKDSNTGFDITMGSYDGAECCELVVVYMLSLLQPICGTTIGLYRDDGLGISKATPQETEHIKKHICKIFKANDLKITIEANKKVVNFLDVTLDLNTGEYMPYMKPNNILQYVHANSNHPPGILKNIPKGVNKRLSEISSSEEVFNKAALQYQKALEKSGYKYKLEYKQPLPQTNKRSRKYNVIWFNPPYDRNVKTNIGKEFLRIIDRCFPRSNKLHKIFNRNTVKISYSTMPSVKSVIEADNKKKLNVTTKKENEKKCSCPRNAICPLEGQCLSKNIIYQATVKSNDKEETYVGLTATNFKSRLANHKTSFKYYTKRNTTELSKYIWSLKENNLDYSISWRILCHASPYSNKTKRCNLCIAEKYFIICKPEAATLNKRTELIGKCRHKDRFLLMNTK